MEITITNKISNYNQNFELSKEKFMFLLQFVNYLTDVKINEDSKEYQTFLADEIQDALLTDRVKSGNSLREII